MSGRGRARDRDRGSVTVEFLAGTVMMLVVVVSVLQVGLYVFVRAVALDAARQGARRGAVLGAGPGEAVATAQAELRRAPALTGGVEVAAWRDGGDVVVSAAARVRGIGFVPDIPFSVEVRARDEGGWADPDAT